MAYQVGNHSGHLFSLARTDRTQRPVNSQAIPQLRKLYADTLVAATTKLPAHSVYRQGVEATVQHRLTFLETVKDDEVSRVEEEIGAGQVEELVESAKDELQLIDMMAELKAYVSSLTGLVPLCDRLPMFTLGGNLWKRNLLRTNGNISKSLRLDSCVS